MALLNTSQSYHIIYMNKDWILSWVVSGVSFKSEPMKRSQKFQDPEASDHSYIYSFKRMQSRTTSYKSPNFFSCLIKRHNNMQRRCLILGKSTQSKSLWTNRNIAKDENNGSLPFPWWVYGNRRSTDTTRFPCNSKKKGARTQNVKSNQLKHHFCVWH